MIVEYIILAYDEATKKSQGDDNNGMKENATIFSQPYAPHKCPVRSFKLYMSVKVLPITLGH